MYRCLVQFQELSSLPLLALGTIRAVIELAHLMVEFGFLNCLGCEGQEKTSRQQEAVEQAQMVWPTEAIALSRYQYYGWQVVN